jgi:hypothetical protein
MSLSKPIAPNGERLYLVGLIKTSICREYNGLFSLVEYFFPNQAPKKSVNLSIHPDRHWERKQATRQSCKGIDKRFWLFRKD